MSTVAPKPPSRPPVTPAIVDSEGFIDEHIQRTRRSLKLVDLAAGLLSLAVAVLAYLLVAAMLDQWVVPGGLGTGGRLALFGVLLVFVAWHAVRHFFPLLRSINPVYAAQTIERSTPSLKNSLLNLLMFRTHRQQMSAKVYHALEQQAAQRLSISTADAAIDHSALLRLGYALLAIVAVCALYSVLSPKNLAVSAARILAPWSELAAPTRVKILEVQPGDTAVARGERLTVSAEIHGARRDEAIRLRYSTADEQAVDESIVMTRPTDGIRYEAQVPRPADAGAASGVMQSLVYWIEAGDAHTREYKVAVFDRPTLVVERVRYEFPAYTGIPSAEVVGTGDLRGIEGTRVTLRAIASQPIKSAAIDFDADGTSDLAMSVEGEQADRAVGSFLLALRDDRRTPAHPLYALRLETTAGRKNADPAQYRIEVTPDYAPEVRITKPEEPETTVRVDEVVLIGAEARDPDFALSQLQLVGKAGERDVAIGNLMPDNKNRDGRVGAMKPFTPADAGLKPGDVLEFWAEARDNRRPQPNVALSEHRRLKIVGGPENGKPPQQPGKQGDNQQPQEGEQSGDGKPQAGQQGGGQQQGGEQQAGDNAGEGQPGQQGVAGGQGEGKQSDKTEGQNSAAGGAGENGDNQQDPAAGGQAGGQKSKENQKPSDPNNPANNQGAQPQPGGQSQQPGGAQQQAGGEADPSGQQNSANAQPSKVSPEGEADGDAFERIQEHFAQENANQQPGGGQQQSGDQAPAGKQQQPGDQQQADKQATGEREANQGANQPNKGQPSGKAPQQPGAQQPKPGDQQTGANPDGKANAQQKPTAGQNGEPQPSGAGKAQSQPGAQDPGQRRAEDKAQEDKTGDGNPGEPRGEKPAGDSVANQNQGNAGSGRATDEDQGAPGLDESAKKAKDKTDADNKRAQGDQEPPSGSPDKRESNSRGSTGGDASGGGQQGGGQKADAQGKGAAGQHEAADQGAGKAAEKGDGETGDQAGDQQLADGKTGQSSGDQPGQGSESREGDKPGAQGKPPGAKGERNKASAGERGKDQNAPPSGEQAGEEAGEKSAGEAGDEAGEQAGDQGDKQAGEQSGQQGGEQAGKQDAGKQDAGKQSGKQSGQQAGDQANPSGKSEGAPKSGSNDSAQSNPQGGAASSQPQGGGMNSGNQAPGAEPPPTAEEIADKANLDFARQQTDLVLEKLDEQLAKKKVDPKILKSLGWTEDELRRFVQRWEGLKSHADAKDPEALKELDAALRSLGLRRGGPLRFRAGATADNLRDLNDAYRTRAPLEYSDRVRAYVKGAAGGEAEK